MLRSGRVFGQCRLFIATRGYALMDRYRFLKEEEIPSETKQEKQPKKKRRKIVTPAGVKEHTPNPVPPKLRDQPISEEHNVPVEHQRSCSIALIGPPNVGKSTLLNKILKDKVAATSSKAQTTRTQITGFTTIENTQLVFLDTPGIVSREKQKKLKPSLVTGSWSALQYANIVLVMADASKNFMPAYYPNFYHVLDTLKAELADLSEPVEVSLVLNKVDKVMPPKKRKQKLDIISSSITQSYPMLQRVFPISVRSGININLLEDYLLASAQYKAWEYPPNATCYISDYQRVMEVIREKIFRRLNKELPYEIEQRNMDWFEMEDGTIRVENNLYVISKSHQKILVGAGGRTLKYICNESEETLKEVFQKNFKIVLCAHVKSQSARTLVNIAEDKALLGYSLRPTVTMAERAHEGGHVFVCRADITKLGCDFWLLPTGSLWCSFDVWMTHWLQLKKVTDMNDVPQDEQPVITDHSATVEWNFGIDFPLIFTYPYCSDSSETLVSIRQALVEIYSLAKVGKIRGPRFRRQRKFIGVPIDISAPQELVYQLLSTFQRVVCDSPFCDLVLVTSDEITFVLAQKLRHKEIESFWPYYFTDPSDVHRHVSEAKELANIAIKRKLVLFVGAGASLGSGMPLWGGLLDTLAEGVDIDTNDFRWKSLDYLNKAELIEKRMAKNGTLLGETIVEMMASSIHSLLHALLACLPVNEIVTTNYDQCIEMASSAVREEAVSVLPFQPNPKSSRWLLKMHGCTSTPDQIVLTRRDYLRYMENNASLAGIVQALLFTSQMLFIGFSLQDDNFHKIADSIRKAVRGNENHQIGITLQLFSNQYNEEMWRDELQFICMEESNGPPDFSLAGRKLEMFMDLVLMLAASMDTYKILDPAFSKILSKDEEKLKYILEQFISNVPPEIQQIQSWSHMKAMLQELGFSDQ